MEASAPHGASPAASPAAASPVASPVASPCSEPAPPPPQDREERRQAAEAAAGLRAAGAKLVCIDFDATFVAVHTGGAWARPARELAPHARGFFLALVPALLRLRMRVAIVTFSPQVALIAEVLALCFPPPVAGQLILRGDTNAWTLAAADAQAFLPLWPAGGDHSPLDRRFKLPFLISAARQAATDRGEPVCSQDTVLIDDDAANVRLAVDCGVLGLFFDPQDRLNAVRRFCRRVHKLTAPPAPVTVADSKENPPKTPEKPPSGRRTRTPASDVVKLVATPETKFIARGGGRHGGSASRFHLCTPSPVLKLRYTVDMGRPRSKRASKWTRTATRSIDGELRELQGGPPPPQPPPQQPRPSPANSGSDDSDREPPPAVAVAVAVAVPSPPIKRPLLASPGLCEPSPEPAPRLRDGDARREPDAAAT